MNDEYLQFKLIYRNLKCQTSTVKKNEETYYLSVITFKLFAINIKQLQITLRSVLSCHLFYSEYYYYATPCLLSRSSLFFLFKYRYVSLFTFRSAEHYAIRIMAVNYDLCQRCRLELCPGRRLFFNFRAVFRRKTVEKISKYLPLANSGNIFKNKSFRHLFTFGSDLRHNFSQCAAKTKENH